MIAKVYKEMLGAKSVIREISEWSTARGAEIGYDNVFDYSLGNPSVPCPASFTAACRDLLEHTDAVTLHGYTPTLTLPEVRVGGCAWEDLNVDGLRGDFDFNRPRLIGHDYDNSFDIPGYTGVFRRAAVLECEMTGIRMTVSTDMPAVQLYTGAFLDGAFSPGDGVCLETQYPPNAVNSPFGPVPLLKKGEVYKFATEFSFSNF